MQNSKQTQINSRVDELKAIYAKIASQNIDKFKKLEDDFILCDGLLEEFPNQFVQYFKPLNLHISNDFIIKATENQLIDMFDFYGDYNKEFRDWFLNQRIQLLFKS